MNNNKARELFWSEHIQRWKKESNKQAEYCSKNNLDQKSFSKWKIRLLKKTTDNSTKFIKIPHQRIQAENYSGVLEIVIKDRYKIIIRSDFNQETLKKIIQTIEE